MNLIFVKKGQITPVFPPETHPVRRGVYMTREVDVETGEPTHEGWFYSFYDSTDKIWGCSNFSPELATDKPEFEFASQHKEWRGLAQEPKP
jgi:hypothetical protein